MQEILIIKATLIPQPWQTQVKGIPYRVIAIPDCLTLYSLAYEIVDSFNFYFDHPFGFYSNKKHRESTEIYELFADLEASGELEAINDDSIKPGAIREGVYGALLYDVFDRPKKKFYFLFDYGDNWNFEIELIAVQPKEKSKKYPRIIEKSGKSPKQYPVWK